MYNNYIFVFGYCSYKEDLNFPLKVLELLRLKATTALEQKLLH
jgi:hypothetical protein